MFCWNILQTTEKAYITVRPPSPFNIYHIISDLEKEGKIVIVGAIYNVETGEVTFL